MIVAHVFNFPQKTENGLNFPKKSENGLIFPKKSEHGLIFPKKSEYAENGLNFPKSQNVLKIICWCLPSVLLMLLMKLLPSAFLMNACACTDFDETFANTYPDHVANYE